MSMTFWQRLVISALFGLSAGSLSPAALQAAQFEQQEIDQSRFIILAAPGGDIGYKLLILEQLNDKRPCWSETAGSPSNVDPLLLNFDFTGICNRIVDSNGFSMRTAGEDQGLQYSLRILREDNDLVLVAASNTLRNTYVEIGRTNGLPTGFSRIVLDPGWRLTRRAFNGRPVGHVYLTYDQPIEALLAASQRNGGTFRPTNPLPQPNSLPSSTSPGTQETPGVIPVPSLPPTAPDGTIAPPRSNQPSGPVVPQAGNLGGPSIILPPPPSSPDSAVPIVLTGGSAANPVEAGSTTDATPENQAVQPTTSARPIQPPTTGSANNSSASNSTGRPFPASLRRNATPSATSTAQADEGTNSENAVSATATSSTAQAETYQVVVVADNAEAQDKVRSVVPNAFLTTINGQVVMQVGMFRDRQDADQLQQRLSLEGLPTAVIPVR